jgi:hypothetical protein
MKAVSISPEEVFIIFAMKVKQSGTTIFRINRYHNGNRKTKTVDRPWTEIFTCQFIIIKQYVTMISPCFASHTLTPNKLFNFNDLQNGYFLTIHK